MSPPFPFIPLRYQRCPPRPPPQSTIGFSSNCISSISPKTPQTQSSLISRRLLAPRPISLPSFYKLSSSFSNPPPFKSPTRFFSLAFGKPQSPPRLSLGLLPGLFPFQGIPLCSSFDPPLVGLGVKSLVLNLELALLLVPAKRFFLEGTPPPDPPLVFPTTPTLSVVVGSRDRGLRIGPRLLTKSAFPLARQNRPPIEKFSAGLPFPPRRLSP